MAMVDFEKGEGAVVKDLNELVQFASGGIVSKTFLERPESKLVLFCMAKGQALSEHTSSMPASIQVLSGKAVITLGEERHEAGPGTLVYMPKEQVHAVDAVEDLVFLLTLFRKS